VSVARHTHHRMNYIGANRESHYLFDSRPLDVVEVRKVPHQVGADKWTVAACVIWRQPRPSQ
jgi:hypothetical protein